MVNAVPNPPISPRTPNSPRMLKMMTPSFRRSVRHYVSFKNKKFDLRKLPPDLQRVYYDLEKKNGEEYALTSIFLIRTAVELHRAWHMTLLTSKILQQVKKEYNVRLTWHLGAMRLKFFLEDGGNVIDRKVPYDYDSEYQDIYTRIAMAFAHRRITIHEALIYQSDTKEGKHTACSGRIIRDFPGRCFVYPIEAATCVLIFFGGSWKEAGFALITGSAAGLIDYGLDTIGGEGKTLTDFMVGMSTGIIGSLIYEYWDPFCMGSVFMGTLYWFFYGTAFVIGLMEIIAGELETGVTRFVAVTVKTFTMSLGAGVGMFIVLAEPQNIWIEQKQYCGIMAEEGEWVNGGERGFRILLYIACSAAALAQYKFPFVDYWRGLFVQVIAYEVQYETWAYFQRHHDSYGMLDIATSNIMGSAAGVVAAVSLTQYVDRIRRVYHSQLLRRGEVNKNGDGIKMSVLDTIFYNVMKCYVRFSVAIGLGQDTDSCKLELIQKIRDQQRSMKLDPTSQTELKLSEKEEFVLTESIVQAEHINVWSVLMPAVYQLVPGSLIAKVWFAVFFPDENNTDSTDVFSSLMVTATSMAVGLIFGFQICAAAATFIHYFPCLRSKYKGKKPLEEPNNEESHFLNGMFSGDQEENDPTDTPDIHLAPIAEEENGMEEGSGSGRDKKEQKELEMPTLEINQGGGFAPNVEITRN